MYYIIRELSIVPIKQENVEKYYSRELCMTDVQTAKTTDRNDSSELSLLMSIGNRYTPMSQQSVFYYPDVETQTVQFAP